MTLKCDQSISINETLQDYRLKSYFGNLVKELHCSLQYCGFSEFNYSPVCTNNWSDEFIYIVCNDEKERGGGVIVVYRVSFCSPHPNTYTH